MTARFFLQKVSPLILFLLPALLVNAQYTSVPTERVVGHDKNDLSEHFTDAEIYRIDLPSMHQLVQSSSFNHAVALKLDGLGEFKFSLVHNPVYNEDLIIRVQTETGIETRPGPDLIKTFKGYTSTGEGKVRLTIDEGFINGFIETRNDIMNIELLSNYVDNAPEDQIVVYYQKNAIDKGPHECGTKDPLKHEDPERIREELSNRAPGDCYEVEVAYANDWLMYDDHGNNVTQVENHNIAVMNNVQANYDDEFEEELVFTIVEIFVSTCSTCDPWTSSTSANALLSDFAGWANGPSGFQQPNDLACIWTDRNFNGPTIGLAWVAAVCFDNFQFCTTQDFSNNAQLLRVLVAHEFGHLFGALHDGSGSPTIMAPSVSNVSSWSTASVNDIDDYIDDINCLGPCPASAPPEAGASSNITEGCFPLEVQFFDNSSGVVEEWQWFFEGGTPNFSSDQDPVVVFQNPGTYDVSLEVSNQAGSNTIFLEDYITVLPAPTADFTYDSDELFYEFTDLSEDASDWFWDFGDGGTSTNQNPFHLYDEDGFYTVVLTVENDCGLDIYELEIEVISVPVASFNYNPGAGCQPLTVQFTNESTPNADEFFWSFEGGIPSESTDENPVVLYEQPGTYSVTFIASNEAGDDIALMSDVITVDPLPIAGFDFAVNGLEAQFLSTASFNNSVTWLFGDGNSSSQDNPTHVYNTGGVYEVMQIAENDCGPDTAIHVLNVDGPPNAGMTVNETEGCSPFTVVYMSTTGGDVDSYQWSFPGGDPSTSIAEMPIVTYDAPGVYNATLVVTNSSGSDTLEIEGIVTVHPDVESAFSFIVDGPIVDFTNESTGFTDIEWIIDGETYDMDNPSVFLEDGEYEVMLIATGPCGSDTSVQVVTVATPPVAGFTIQGGSSTGCQPFTVQFMSTSSSNSELFEWSFPGGTPATSMDENPLVTYNEPGTYSVSLVVTSQGGTDEVVFDDFIEVNPLPTALFTTVQNGTVVDFENMSEDADDFDWYFGDGETSGANNPTHDFGDFGTYEITLIAFNNCGSDTTTLLLELAGLPVPDFSVEEQVGCSPFTVKFKDESQNGATSWEWEFEGGDPQFSTKKNPTVVYEEPGVYTVRLTAYNNAGSQALVRLDYITVEAQPESVFDAQANGDQVEFENLSENATSYLWNFGDNTTDTTQNPVHVYAGTGTYTVQLIAYNSCGADTFYLDVDVLSTSILIPYDKGQHSVWPNPNNGNFNLDIPETEGTSNARVEIIDVSGRVVYSAKQEEWSGTNRLKVHLSVDAGLYYVIYQGSDGRQVFPVVISD